MKSEKEQSVNHGLIGNKNNRKTIQFDEYDCNHITKTANSSRRYQRKKISFYSIFSIAQLMIKLLSDKKMIQKGIYSLKKNGLRVTLQEIKRKNINREQCKIIATQALFSDKELDEQRSFHFSKRIRISIITPVYNTPVKFLREMIESVQAQTYTDWELCISDGSDEEHVEVGLICQEYARKDQRIHYQKLDENLGISGNTNNCIKMANGDAVALLDHDDLLHPAALFEVVRAFCEEEADFVYTDEAVFASPDISDITSVNFKPDFAPDNLRANNYICHFTVFKRTLLDEVGLFDSECDGSQDHDIILRLTEKAQCIAHIPEILYYWRSHMGSVAESANIKPYVFRAGILAVEKQLKRLRLDGKIETIMPGLTIYRTRYAVQGTPKVSILISNCEHLKEIRRCLESILKKTTWLNYEIVIIDNNSKSPALIKYYNKLQKERSNIHIINSSKKLNHSAINNYGAKFCSGEYLLLLSNSTTIITENWIEEMLMFAQREDVGAVGSMIYYPDNTIQHAGIVCLPEKDTISEYIYRGKRRKSLGYMRRLCYAQNMTAVSATCMMIRASLYSQIGGFDEKLTEKYNDVDLCLSIRNMGYYIIWTPFAELYNCEKRNYKIDDSTREINQVYSELPYFRQKREKELMEGDPYYNPNFSTEGEAFSFKRTMQQYNYKAWNRRNKLEA